MMRAFYDLGDRGLAGRDIDRTNRVLGANYRLCECRCGGETAISHKTDVSKGWAEGSPYRFKRGHATPEKKLLSDRGYDHRVLSELELGWVAGLLEGERGFCVRKGKRKNGFSCTPTIQFDLY
jgi:hypothetical protein